MRELSRPQLPGPRDQTSIDFDAEFNFVFNCETEQDSAKQNMIVVIIY